MSAAREKARALLAYATPGPWFSQLEVPIFPNAYVVGCPESTVIARVSRSSEQCMVAPKRARPEHDAALIAAAPGLLAALCDELHAAEAERDTLKSKLTCLNPATGKVEPWDPTETLREIRECVPDDRRLDGFTLAGVVSEMARLLAVADAKVARMEARTAAPCGCADDGEGNEPFHNPACPDCHGSGAVIVEGGK